MRGFISIILSVIMVMNLVSCGQEVNETEKIKIERNEQPLTVRKIEIPIELQGYKYVYVKSFDGQYAVFTVERVENIGDESYAGDTGKIIVYDVLNENIVHFINLDINSGKVGSAVKKGDKLYYTLYNRLDLNEKVYENNGLENQLLYSNSLDQHSNFSRLSITDDKLYMICSKGEIGLAEYEFFALNEDEFKSVGVFKQESEGFAVFLGMKDGKPIVNSTVIGREEITFDRWIGDKKETVFRLKSELSHSYGQLDNMFIHPVESIDNDGRYNMMAVTDLNNKNVTEIGMMQGGFFDIYDNKGLMFTYGKSNEEIFLYEAKDNILEISPVNIDVKGMNNHSYYMTDKNAFMIINSISFENLNMVKSEHQWYLLEY